MITRLLFESVNIALGKYPIIAITGPRQSGKTTFAKMLRPNYKYVNLEDISIRQFALEDPKGFLETYQNGIIIDEIQYAPVLFSYLQLYTDERSINGEYIITGSQNFLMMEQISQSLAGRVALFTLLPLSFQEIEKRIYSPQSWEEYLLAGSYPRKWTQNIDANEYYDNYLKTYIERDVRMIKNIANLGLFQKFIQLLAGRVGQLLNQSSIGVELGIDNKTVESWITLLEISFIAFRLRPYHKNFNKRVIKTPKIYFYDTGLLATLLNIRSVEELNIHYAKGSLFENLIILEILKRKTNKLIQGDLYFWRDSVGTEIDLLIDQGVDLKAIEIKSGKTIQTDFFKSLVQFKSLETNTNCFLIYGGNDFQKRSNATVLGFKDLGSI